VQGNDRSVSDFQFLDFQHPGFKHSRRSFASYTSLVRVLGAHL
jgi:hypothetical protein